MNYTFLAATDYAEGRRGPEAAAGEGGGREEGVHRETRAQARDRRPRRWYDAAHVTSLRVTVHAAARCTRCSCMTLCINISTKPYAESTLCLKFMRCTMTSLYMFHFAYSMVALSL